MDAGLYPPAPPIKVPDVMSGFLIGFYTAAAVLMLIMQLLISFSKYISMRTVSLLTAMWVG